MSWHYLRELEGESLEDICSGGEPLPPLKSKTTHDVFYCSGKLTESYLDSLSGTTSAHLTENRGEEKSTLSAGDSPAKISVAPGKVRALLEQEAAYGERWRESLARYDPASCSWKTAQCSLFGGLEPFLETWPQWGMMHDGECSERVMSAHPTSGIESGSWPTPRKTDYKGSGKTGQLRDRLDYAVERGGTKTQPNYATPQSRDYRTGEAHRWDNKAERSRNLNDQCAKTEQHGQLNPSWVEWLMGWPIGWTDLKPLATGKFQQWLDSHGKS
jgi:hypothetical protein